MRNSILQIGECFKGYYYGIEEKNIQDGKKHYEYENLPKTFNFKTTTISGSAVFTSSKGYEKKQQILNGTLITESQIFRIQTSNSEIDFKNGGKVKILINNVWKDFIISKTTILTNSQNIFSSTRFGYLDESKFPIMLELR